MKLRYYATVGAMLATLAASPVLAEETSPPAATPAVPPAATDIKPNKPVMPKLNLACMQTAVEKRDNAIIAAVDTNSSAVKTALTVRRDALKAAWGITDRKERNSKIRAAWDAFSGTWRKAAMALNKSRREAWQQFRADGKSCHANGEGSVEMRGEGSDAKL